MRCHDLAFVRNSVSSRVFLGIFWYNYISGSRNWHLLSKIRQPQGKFKPEYFQQVVRSLFLYFRKYNFRRELLVGVNRFLDKSFRIENKAILINIILFCIITFLKFLYLLKYTIFTKLNECELKPSSDRLMTRICVKHLWGCREVVVI